MEHSQSNWSCIPSFFLFLSIYTRLKDRIKHLSCKYSISGQYFSYWKKWDENYKIIIIFYSCIWGMVIDRYGRDWRCSSIKEDYCMQWWDDKNTNSLITLLFRLRLYLSQSLNLYSTNYTGIRFSMNHSYITSRECMRSFLDRFVMVFDCSDIRHNFSIYFYPLYLAEGNEWMSTLISKGVFIPQLICILLFSIRYRPSSHSS